MLRRCRQRDTLRNQRHSSLKRVHYGLGDTDGAAFLSKTSGSFVSLKSAGTVNSLSGIEARLTAETVLIISVGWPETLASCPPAPLCLPIITRIRSEEHTSELQ